MDLILELSVDRLLDIVRVKFAEQGVAPDIQFEQFGDQWALHDLALSSLSLSVVEMERRSWNRPLLGPALDTFSFIPVQRVRGRIGVALGFTSLASLRSHRPDDSGPPTRVHRTIGVTFEPQLRITSGGVSMGIDVQGVDITLPVPSDATEEQRRAIADQERVLRDRALTMLRSAARGLDVALPIGVLGELIPGATRVLNAGLVAEPHFTATGALDPSGTARFIQIGVQVDRPEWVLLSELQRAQLVIRKGEEWRRFNQSPTTRSFRFGFGIFLSGEALVATTTSIINTSVTSASDRLRLRGAIDARWIEPERAAVEGNVRLQFPVTALNACGTGHHLDANVTSRIHFSIPAPDQIEIAVLLDYGVDAFPLLGCAFEVGGIGAFIGLVIGGLFGGWIGALVGAILGFLIGFIGVLIVGGTYRTGLGGLPRHCIETPAHDVHCTFPLPPAGGDAVLSALRLRNALPTAEGLSIVAALEFPAPGPPPRIEATIFEPLHWYQRAFGGWVMRGRIFVTNVGGGEIVIGAVTPIEASASLYLNRIRFPRYRIFTRASAFIDVEVPWSEVEAARTAGTLTPAHLLIFSTGGVRLVQFTEVPETLTSEQMELADQINLARIELDRIGEGLALIGTSLIPPLADPRQQVSLNQAALIQATVRQSVPKAQWALATVGGQLLAHSFADEFGNVFISTITAPPTEPLRLVNLPLGAGKDLAAEVKQAVDKGAAFADEISKTFHALLANALQTDQKAEAVIDVGLERPALLSKIDVKALREGVAALAKKFGQRDQKLTISKRVSLLAELQGIPSKSAGLLMTTSVDGEAVLSTTVDQFPVYLSMHNGGGFLAEDATGSQQLESVASSQTLPKGFVEFAGYLIGWREGKEKSTSQLTTYAMIDRA